MLGRLLERESSPLSEVECYTDEEEGVEYVEGTQPHRLQRLAGKEVLQTDEDESSRRHANVLRPHFAEKRCEHHEDGDQGEQAGKTLVRLNAAATEDAH